MRGSDGGQEAERGWLVRGRVQGVGFRWWTRHWAEDLGVVGSVENLPDGAVRVMARGHPEALDRLEAALGDGPAAAHVEGIDRMPVDLPADARAFRILR
jgi:acylphosphatase